MLIIIQNLIIEIETKSPLTLNLPSLKSLEFKSSVATTWNCPLLETLDFHNSICTIEPSLENLKELSFSETPDDDDDFFSTKKPVDVKKFLMKTPNLKKLEVGEMVDDINLTSIEDLSVLNSKQFSSWNKYQTLKILELFE